MEADKCPDVQSEQVSQKPKRANGVIPVQRLAGAKTQEEPVFQVKSKGRQKLVSQFGHDQSGFTLTQDRGILFVLFRP